MHIGSKLGALIININRPNSPNYQSQQSRIPIHRSPRSIGNHQLLTTNHQSLITNQLGGSAAPFMQNKPNSQNQETNLTPYPKNNYAKTYSLRPQKNKPKTNPIPNTPSAPRCSLRSPRPRKSAFGTLPPGLCLLRAKTPKNHNLIMQNKPNSKNPKPNLTPYPKKNYAKNSSLTPQKNKPNSNPIPTQSPRPERFFSVFRLAKYTYPLFGATIIKPALGLFASFIFLPCPLDGCLHFGRSGRYLSFLSFASLLESEIARITSISYSLSSNQAPSQRLAQCNSRRGQAARRFNSPTNRIRVLVF